MLKHHLHHFSHVIGNYRHIFTVLANFRVRKSQTFFCFCCPWTPALWSHSFNNDENPPLNHYTNHKLNNNLLCNIIFLSIKPTNRDNIRKDFISLYQERFSLVEDLCTHFSYILRYDVGKIIIT